MTIPRSNAVLSAERLLFMYGFVKSKYQPIWKEKYGSLSESKRRAALMALPDEEINKHLHRQHMEVTDEGFKDIDYPGGCAHYHLILESASENIEEPYFDILERSRQHFGFPKIYKVSDYFAASENSAFFGNSQQRIGIQQDRVQQFLANIGKFVKELFQMVRELRIIDERLEMYRAADGVVLTKQADNSFKELKENKPSHAADVSLKSIFTDLVEGGTKNPQSVFGLASQVNFTLLPDLFFNTYIEKQYDVDKVVDAMPYNKSLTAVLKRKLYQYLVWKEKTYAELKSRRQFNVKYLRQHWTIIKLYMSWVKPYLRNIQRLSMNQQFLESPDIIAAFETALIEVEFLAERPIDKQGFHPIVIATFQFRTRPDMSVRKEYQQGPSHMGRMDMSLRAYGWSPEQRDNYLAMKQREEIELLGLIDSSLADIMDALGDEFEKYLKEAGEIIDEPQPKPVEKRRGDSPFAPFFSVFAGFKEIAESFIPVMTDKSDTKKSKSGSSKKAFGEATGAAGNIYHTFKKAHKMITW